MCQIKYILFFAIHVFAEYYSEEGKPFELRLVGKIKQQLSTDPTLHPEYPSSLGLKEFTRKATEVALGKHSRAIVENQVMSATHRQLNSFEPRFAQNKN